VSRVVKTTVTEANEKKCRWCGRVGTRAFIPSHPDGPAWMGPWRCQWTGPCDRRREAAGLAEVARQVAPVVPVDLDVIHEEG
jgi:hypothetical protein